MNSEVKKSDLGKPFFEVVTRLIRAQRVYFTSVRALLAYVGGPHDSTKVGGEPGYRPQEFAKTEVDAGFATLNGTFIVSFWALLEAFVGDLLASILLEQPDALSETEYRKIKIGLLDFQQLDERDRMGVVVREIRSRLSPPKFGVDEFEALLTLVSFGGTLDAELRRTLNELCALRNVILHKGGRVDWKFRSACPWSNRVIGEIAKITNEDFDRFYSAVVDYIRIITDRLLARQRTKEAKPDKEDTDA